MTCIVGLVHEGAVFMGGDSAAVGDQHYLTRTSNPKVFRNGDYLIGYTSSFRMGQLLEFADLPPADAENIYRFMATTFVERVRVLMRDGGYMKVVDSREKGGVFMVGVKGKLFEVDDDYHARELLEGYNAVGCGISVALGSLFSTIGVAPEQRIKTALKAAEAFVTGVRAPFHVMSINN